MHPTSIFNWHDNSGIVIPEAAAPIDDAPLFMQIFAAEKGPEDFIEISGTANFDSTYGNVSFLKYGQASIQARNIINAGGRLLAKRVVAEDSTLANVILCANITKSEGAIKVKWTSQSVEGKKTFDEVLEAAKELLNAENGVYPLLVYTDNGRGVSGKAVRLNPDYATSKTIGKTFYTLTVYEGATVSETKSVAFDPTTIYAGTSYKLDRYSSVQVTAEVIEDIYDLYVAEIADTLGLDEAVARSYDIVYGYTNRGVAIDGFTLDEESVDLDSSTGIALTMGTNGNFGDNPMSTASVANYEKQLCRAFGDATQIAPELIDPTIYDVDQHKIALILDANYPLSVKKAIFELVEFREDCSYLRDYGTECNTYLDIVNYHQSLEDQCNIFTSDYCTSYQIIDPASKRNIKVTMMYDLASVLVNHIANNANAPLAGQVNGFILQNAIKGTINFIPINTPKFNQKQAIDDLRVNYAIFEDDNCIVQSSYTSQKKYTQLSYSNNVIAIQRVLRAIRTACPRERYALSTTADLQNYRTMVNNVLQNFISDFSILNFVYTQNELQVSQKIFAASIEFAFYGWAQTEIFDIYAINND